MSSAGGSFNHVSLHLGSDWDTRCSTYADTTPILSVDAGDAWVSFSIAGREVTEAAVAFARALVRETQAFAAEIERMHAASLAADPSDSTESADQAA